MTPRNWFNAIVGCAASIAAIASTSSGLDWFISWAFVSCAVLCAVDLAYCVHQESKGITR